MEATVEDWRVDELAEVYRRRYIEARKAGIEHQDAIMFARGSGDIGVLRKLVAGGCPANTIVQIVL
jgi:hypothetical protein